MKTEKQQLLIIILIVFIGFVGTSMAYPIFPPLFLHPSSNSIIPASWLMSTRSILLGIALAAYPLGQFAGSPIFGGCSDRYGRKRMLMLSLTGSVIGYLMTAISLQFNCLWLLLFSRFLTGVMEGNLAIVRAMAADLTGISKFKSIGRINSAAAIGYVLGPLLGGFLSDKHLVAWFSYAFPFYIALLFSGAALFLTAVKISDKIHTPTYSEVTILQRFNLVGRFKHLFKNNITLKYLLITSTIFTFSVDIFYEFGPVYLTGLWSLSPGGIAIYNAALSLTLAIGSGWLPHHLSQYFTVKTVVIVGMFLTSIVLGCLAIFPSPLLALILFTLIGLCIACVNTNITIQVSNSADRSIQGEAMGAQLSLRMLGDAVICLVGSFLIISSVILPIALSCVIALAASSLYSVTALRERWLK